MKSGKSKKRTGPTKRSPAKTSRASKKKCKPPAKPVEPPKPSRDPVAQVMAWALSGASERDIMAAIAANYPGDDAPALLTAVVDDLRKSASASPDVLIGWCFEATRELYRRMVEIGDYPGAKRAAKIPNDS